MMKKFFIIFFLLLLSNIAQAGSYEDAVARKDKVFLYIYTPQCTTCQKFNPIFDNLKQSNKDYEFVSVNAETPYGLRLIYKFKGRFVPYIILTNSKTKKSVNVNHTCVMDEVCLLRAMKSFN